MDEVELGNRFAFWPASDEEKRSAHGSARAICAKAAHDLNDLLPDGREKSLAITSLETCMFWANAGLARPPSERSRH